MSVATFAVFKMATGRIDRVVSCPAECIEPSLAADEDALVATNETDASHYVRNGALVPFPPRPGAAYQWNWQSMAWVLDTDLAWKLVRHKRNQLLTAADWTQLPDAPLTVLQKTAWTAYRQQLRDVTNQADPTAIAWPVQPQ
jgi:hypothetical protein